MALHVHLAAWLGEREVVRAEAGDGVLTVELFHERVERALQVRHRDALVDDHALDLVEHGRVRGVHLVLAVDAAGGDHADRQRLALHGAHLHRGGLRAQEDAAVLGQIERVRPLAGGVALAGVELGEVVFGLFDLGAFEDLKAHADEDVLNLVEHDVHRVLVAELRRFSGHGHVERLGLEAHLEHAGVERLAALVDRFLQFGAHLVCQLAHGRALLRRQAAHLLEDGGQLTLFAEVLHTQVFQRGDVVRLQNGGDGSLAQLLQHFFHANNSSVARFSWFVAFLAGSRTKKDPPVPHTGTKGNFRGTTRIRRVRAALCAR